MKKLLWIILFLPILCLGQNLTTGVVVDSISVTSRIVADSVLRSFESFPGLKLLYSIQNNRFYVCIKHGNNYQEFYITGSESSGFKVTKLKVSRKSRKKLSKAFRLEKYHNDFITSMPEAKFIQGYPSYFVIKDEYGKRYGEYSLSYLTIPNPINSAVYGYLIKRMSELVNLEYK